MRYMRGTFRRSFGGVCKEFRSKRCDVGDTACAQREGKLIACVSFSASASRSGREWSDGYSLVFDIDRSVSLASVILRVFNTRN